MTMTPQHSGGTMPPSIFGTSTINIRSCEQAKNLLDMADIARAAGVILSTADQAIELAAFRYLREPAHKRLSGAPLPMTLLLGDRLI